MATGGDTDLLEKDLMKIANASAILTGQILKLAVEYLDLEASDVDKCGQRATAGSGDESVKIFYCLLEWKNRKGRTATRRVLYDILSDASNTGMINMSKVDFLAGGPVPETPDGFLHLIAPFQDPGQTTDKKDKEVENIGAQDVGKILYEPAGFKTIDPDVPLTTTYYLTVETDLRNWQYTRFCRLNGGEMVIYGWKKNDTENKGPGFYVYSKGGVKMSRLEDHCKDKDSHPDRRKESIVAVKIASEEYVAIACSYCQAILLMHVDQRRILKAYENKQVAFGPMCKNETENIAHLVAKKQRQKTQSVVILDTTHKNFNELKPLTTDISEAVASVAHAANRGVLILLGNYTRDVFGISDKSGVTLWRVATKLTAMCRFSMERVGANVCEIIGADDSNSLKVSSIVKGESKQDIDMSAHGLNSISIIDCFGDVLIVQQENGGNLCFSLYHVACDLDTST